MIVFINVYYIVTSILTTSRDLSKTIEKGAVHVRTKMHFPRTVC